MKVWEVTIPNEHLNYWRFRDEEEKYDIYKWHGEVIDNWQLIKANINEDETKPDIQVYLKTLLSNSNVVLTLKSKLELSNVQFLPFKDNSNDPNNFIWNILKVDDVLNEEECELKIFKNSGRIRGIKKYSFNEAIVRGLDIFKVKYEGARLFVTDNFIKVYKELGLTGLGFECVWDSTENAEEEVNQEESYDINDYKRHIEENIGSIKSIYREEQNIDVPFDILIVENQDYTALVTCGLGRFDMNVPEEMSEYKNVEFMMFLDKNFKIDSEGINKEENYWVLNLLKVIASYPLRSGRWLGWGHTISNSVDDKPYCSKVGYSSAFIYPPTVQNDAKFFCFKNENSNVYIYNIMPVYKEEKEFILNNSGDDFFDLMGERGISQVITNCRENLCKEN